RQVSRHQREGPGERPSVLVAVGLLDRLLPQGGAGEAHVQGVVPLPHAHADEEAPQGARAAVVPAAAPGRRGGAVIKTTVKTVTVTPVDAERTPVGPATEAVQHILYHVQESPGKATHSMAMIDSGLVLEVYGDRTVAALHVV